MVHENPKTSAAEKHPLKVHRFNQIGPVQNSPQSEQLPACRIRARGRQNCETSGHRRRELGFFAQERENFFNQRVGCDTVLLP
jgi:hypothetical protein